MSYVPDEVFALVSGKSQFEMCQWRAGSVFNMPTPGYPLKFYLLVPLRLEFLELISFVFIITVAILIAEKLLQRFKPAMHEKIAIFIPMTLVNCSALGIALLSVQQSYGFFGSLFFGLGSGVGFGLVIVTLSAIQERLEVAEVPKPFQGVAIVLITLGIISMAFMGFNGIVN